MADYDVYSEFDLQQHKEHFVNDLEVMIDSDGAVHYAVPSHQEYAIAEACRKLGVTRQELSDMTPKEYYFDWLTWLLLLLAGAVTAIPLLLYGKAAERITLTALGFLQYVSPTGQFLIGIFVYKESFTTAHIVCFTCIWIGLTIFTIDIVRRLRASQATSSRT